MREAFSVQHSQGLDTLMTGLDLQALDLLKVCPLHLFYLHFHFLLLLNWSHVRPRPKSMLVFNPPHTGPSTSNIVLILAYFAFDLFSLSSSP